jgi:hypothetical protein
MKRKTSLLTGAAAATLVAGVAVSSPAMADPIPQASSYADLFDQVPGAQQRLAADDAAQVQTVQDWRWRGRPERYEHHHHHHHQRYDRRYYESRGYIWNGWQWVPRRVYHHHHHHHHHHNYDGGGWG